MFDKYLRDFGFGSRTDITLDGETYGQLESVNRWSRAKLFTMSFGQGITATVLQMGAAYNVIANGGVYVKPYIVSKIRYSDGREINQESEIVRRVIKEETAESVRAMLVEGATVGYAAAGGVAGYKIGGKTGTSQIASRGVYEKCDAGCTVTSYG